jgi:hypothetical protein
MPTPPPEPSRPNPPDRPSDDAALDEALEETFPASDPIAIDRPRKPPPEHPPGSDVREP